MDFVKKIHKFMHRLAVFARLALAYKILEKGEFMEFHFNAEMARLFGIDEAVFVHNVIYWIKKNEANGKNIFDGKAWTYNTAKALTELFPFWTDRQIQRVIKNCRDKGLIETRQLSENKRDRTLYYTVTETVKCIYANGGMVEPKRVNGFTQTRKCIYSTDSNTNNKPDRESETRLQITYVMGEFENVNLTLEELNKLKSRWSPEQVESMIENLSSYLVNNTKKKYKNHYAVLLTWLRRDCPQIKQAEKLTGKRKGVQEI